jgi:hypothetical protein
MRISAHHNRTPSAPRRDGSTDRLRTEVTHIYKLTSRFLADPDVYNNDWILNNLVTYTKELRIFLSDAEVQTMMDFQKLRLHFCGLMEELFEGINRSKTPSRWLPFESRKSAFALMEEWAPPTGRREDTMRFNFTQQPDTHERPRNVLVEIGKKELKTAALSAMASLCVSRTGSKEIPTNEMCRQDRLALRLKAIPFCRLISAGCFNGSMITSATSTTKSSQSAVVL